MKKHLIIFEAVKFQLLNKFCKYAIAQGYELTVLVPKQSASCVESTDNVTCIAIDDFKPQTIRSWCEKLFNKDETAGIGSISHASINAGFLPAVEIAHFCREKGLNGNNPDALYLNNNKFLMRETLAELANETIGYQLVESESQVLDALYSIGAPILIKPMVGMASSFISVCKDVNDASQKYHYIRKHINSGYYALGFSEHEYRGVNYRPLTQLLVEQALVGYELSVECLCTEDDVIPLLLHDKLDMQQREYTSFENCLITPSPRISEAESQAIKQYAVDLIKTIGLKNCFCHFELMYDPSTQKPAVIEINHRLAGMRVYETLTLACGINIEDIFLKQMTGETIILPEQQEPTEYLGMMAIYPEKSGYVDAINGLDEARNFAGLIDIKPHVEIGEYMGGDHEEIFAIDAVFKAGSPQGIIELHRQIRNAVELKIREK